MRTPSDLTTEEWDQLVTDYKSGSTALELARRYTLKEDSLRAAFRRRDVHKDGNVRHDVIEPELTDADYVALMTHDREVQSLRSRLKHVEGLYRASIRSASIQDHLVDMLQDTVQAMPVLSGSPITVKRDGEHGLHTLGLALSDLHNGEVVDSEVMGGFGGYNMTIFRERVGLWVKKVLYLLDIYRSRLEIPRLVIFADGDFISGLIHDELLKSNEVNILEQTTTTAMAIAWAIREISSYFEEVEISCTVGNHGRNQQKVEFKDPYVNWDYICYQIMACLLKDATHIKFDIPKSIWQVTQVENTKFLHYHGHGIKGWAGIPYYGIERAIKDLRETLAVGDMHFDGIILGHFHVPFEITLPGGPLIVNGCWKGGDEYALFGLRKWIPPYQTMFLVHEEHGYVDRKLIHLAANSPKDALDVPTTLGPVWADSMMQGRG